MQLPLTPSSRFQRWFLMGSLALSVAASIPTHGQSISQNWQGMAGPGFVPPDPHGAPGPAGVIATVNLQISYYNKTGGVIWGPVTLPGTFFPANTGTGNQNSDPRVVFDSDSRRFFVIMQENHNSTFWLNVAVSRSANPQSSGTNDWLFYRLNATEFAGSNNAGGINYGGDYPGLAVDSRALYVTYRMYGFLANGLLSGAGANYINNALLILNKNSLLNGPGAVVSLYQNSFGLQAVTPQDGTTSNVMYMVGNIDNNNTNSNNSITIVSVTDPLGARTVSASNIAITERGTGPGGGAPQSGSAFTIPTIDRTMGNASLVNGDIWFCASRGVTGGRAVVAYYRVRLNGWPTNNSPTLAEEGVVGNSGEWNFCPTIGVNKKGDAAITWTRSSASIFPSIVVAFRAAGAASFGAPQNVTPSITLPGNIVVNNTFNVDGRWGDYFSVWPDPNDGSFWVTNMWTRADTGTWSTWWTQITVPAEDSYVDLNGNFFFQNGTSVFPWVTVGIAHAAITTGTIHIAPGHYNEQITLNKSVTLVINGAGQVVIGAP